jgi:hypothetical protein
MPPKKPSLHSAKRQYGNACISKYWPPQQWTDDDGRQHHWPGGFAIGVVTEISDVVKVSISIACPTSRPSAGSCQMAVVSVSNVLPMFEWQHAPWCVQDADTGKELKGLWFDTQWV